jgi:hypothetical protein
MIFQLRKGRGAQTELAQVQGAEIFFSSSKLMTIWTLTDEATRLNTENKKLPITLKRAMFD